MPEEAFRVHGLSRDFLAGKPKFAEIAGSLVEFLADAHLVIHNAEFDMKFINAELGRCGVAPIAMDQVVDTLADRAAQAPGRIKQPRRAVCALPDRQQPTHKHGALLDAEILARLMPS